jgi:hypothetical protein
MASTGLTNGPFLRSDIDKHVKAGRSIGVYVLGTINPKTKNLIVKYVGRSDHHDDGLNARLHEHDDDDEKAGCTHFKFGYLGTAEEAYERESMIFHEFPNLLNANHPPVPDGTEHPCPFDGCDHPFG